MNSRKKPEKELQNKMKLKKIGARILAAFLCISILLIATAEGARNGTISVSGNNNRIKSASANKGKTGAIHRTRASPNNGKIKLSAYPGKTTRSVNNGRTAAPSHNYGQIASAAKKKQNQQYKQFTPKFNWEQQQYLKAHNDLRRKSRVPLLKWDAGLTAYAHSWAMKRRRDCKHRKHSNGRYGENSFWMQYKDFKPPDVVQNWFSEQQLFDHARNLCKCKIENEECECGHYLNVIGKSTTKVGCSGYVYCSDQKGVIVYCSYDPPTNYYPGRHFNPRNPQNRFPRRLLSFI